MNKLIKIKAYYSDWEPATIEQAKKLFNHLMRPWDETVFSNHFQGITYEELSVIA